MSVLTITGTPRSGTLAPARPLIVTLDPCSPAKSPHSSSSTTMSFAATEKGIAVPGGFQRQAAETRTAMRAAHGRESVGRARKDRVVARTPHVGGTRLAGPRIERDVAGVAVALGLRSEAPAPGGKRRTRMLSVAARTPHVCGTEAA
eukprot:720358-Rhodomonas_salina.1